MGETYRRHHHDRALVRALARERAGRTVDVEFWPTQCWWHRGKPDECKADAEWVSTQNEFCLCDEHYKRSKGDSRLMVRRQP